MVSQRGFPPSKEPGPSFYPVLEINWADMEKDEKIIFGDNLSDNPTAHAWIVDSLRGFRDSCSANIPRNNSFGNANGKQ